MTKAHRKRPCCPNCDTLLRPGDNYCPVCGQTNHDLRVPFGHLLMEALEGIVHFDSKSFRTVAALLFRPGSLTNEFKAGRRVKYVPPMRLYIFLSFVFFLLLSLGSGKHNKAPQGEPGAAQTGQAADSVEAKAPNELNITLYTINSVKLRGLSDSQIDSLLQAEDIGLNPFNRFMARQLGRIEGGGKAEFSHRLLTGVSYMMFALMPIFALFPRLFFRKQAGYYVDCLVFSVHFHSFVFILFSIFVLLGFVIDTAYLILATPLILGVYCYLGYRTVFGQSRFVTLAKTFIIGLLYLVSIVLCFSLTIMVSIALF